MIHEHTRAYLKHATEAEATHDPLKDALRALSGVVAALRHANVAARHAHTAALIDETHAPTTALLPRAVDQLVIADRLSEKVLSSVEDLLCHLTDCARHSKRIHASADLPAAPDDGASEADMVARRRRFRGIATAP